MFASMLRLGSQLSRLLPCVQLNSLFLRPSIKYYDILLPVSDIPIESFLPNLYYPAVHFSRLGEWSRFFDEETCLECWNEANH